MTKKETDILIIRYLNSHVDKRQTTQSQRYYELFINEKDDE